MAETKKHILERQKLETEIKEKDGNLLIKKVDALRCLLNDYTLETKGTKEEGDYTPVITLEINRGIIEEKIMNLIKQF